MAEAIKVRSVDAIEQFRRRLLVFIGKAKPLVEDAYDDVSRTREWLGTNRRLHWENELRRRKQILQEAQEKYFSARLSTLRDATTAEMLAMKRAKADVEFAEQKLVIIRRWSRELEHQVWPLLKQLEQLQSSLTTDLPDGCRFLSDLLNALDLYRENSRPNKEATTPPPETELQEDRQ